MRAFVEPNQNPIALGLHDSSGRHKPLVHLLWGGWGHTTVDQVVFSDDPSRYSSPREVPGFGSMSLSLVGGASRTATDLGPDAPGPLDPARVVERLDRGRGPDDGARAAAARPVGALGRSATLRPGASATFDFLLTWWFPSYGEVTGEMAVIAGMPRLARHYARRFDGAAAVAAYVAEHFGRLAGQTRLWNQTWYDSTLPYWLLDRTFVTVDCLATQTFHAFDDGRYWSWEGVNCCPGTCQHVWHYAQAVARLFPAIERDLRERVDFGLARHESGAMDYRAENARAVAHDGFCGTILRAYREHLMSADSAFLARLWPRLKRSIEFLLDQDRDGGGLLEGEQMNTLDAAWFGAMGWISSLYLAALAAGAAMADERGDAPFAVRCRAVLDAGRRNLVARLYNGEYFIHKPDPAHPEANSTNDGCHIDQVFGQSWAWQVGLPRVVPERECRSALRSLWAYNLTPDVGPWRAGMKSVLPAGRWYALPGEGGLIMCTWPRGGAERAAGRRGDPTFVGYFTECMTGFEYQVAAHLIWEGMVTEGLVVARLIHDRYHAARRNPYNEVECSDHYARAMSGYGAFLAACGFEYHGPKGHLGFAPRIMPGHFRAAFTAAEGWGTLAQDRTATRQTGRIELKWGQLRLKTLSFAVVEGRPVAQVRIVAAGRPVAATHAVEGLRVTVALVEETTLRAGQTLEVEIA
jgi:hypothetical protein